jgi:hypothetical protein
MAPAATRAARTATAPARSPRVPARRPAKRRPSSGRSQSARRPRTARPYAGTPMPARLVPIAVGRTAGAVSGLAELGVVHRLTRGRLWIGALAALLVGIVALNVVALSFNASSSKATRQTDVLERQISTLRAQIAATGASNERVQSLAAGLGMTVPEPGAIGYVNASESDAARAAERLASGQISSGPVPLVPSIETATTTTTATTVTDPAAVTVAPPATTVP